MTKRYEQIRVHGVAGTPPERILDTFPRPIDGGASAAAAIEMHEAHDPLPPGFDRLLSVSWSSLTSGSPAQAFNVVLTPFLLTNTAGWMAPRRGPVRAAVGIAAHRVAALTATGIMATGLCWALFVVPTTGCRLLDATTGSERGGIPPETTCTLSVAFVEIDGFSRGVPWALSAAFTLFVLSLLPAWALWDSHRFQAELDRALEAGPPVDVAGAGAAGPAWWPRRVLDDERHPATTVLRLAHWLVAAAMLLCCIGIDHRSRPTYTAGVVLTCVAFGLAGGLRAPGVLNRSSPVTFAVFGALAATTPAIMAWVAPTPWTVWASPAGQMLAYFYAVNWVTLLGAAAVGVLVVLFWMDGDTHRRWAGFNAAAVTSFSLIVAGVLAAGLALMATGQLQVNELRRLVGDNTPLAVVFVDTVLLLVWGSARALRRTLGTDRGGLCVARASAAMVRRRPMQRLAWLGLAQLVALVLYVVPLFLDQLRVPLPGPPWLITSWIAAPTMLIALAGAAEIVIVLNRAGGSRVNRLLRQSVGIAAALLLTWRIGVDLAGTFEWLALSLPTLLVVQLLVQGLRKRESRRGAAIIRDAAGFWPRSFHPLVPRPYGALAIAGLRAELASRDRTDQVEHTVVCGHSQGSVLVLSAVLGMPAAARQRLSTIVYGSPVTNLYRAAFPAHFGRDWFDSAEHLLSGRLRSLYRDTDPVAAPCGIEGIDMVVRDHDEVRMHSRYEAEETFVQAAQDLRRPGP